MSPGTAPRSGSAVHSAPLEGGGTGLIIFGELDAATEPEMAAAIEEAIAGSGPVLIDLRACGFVDSKGVAVLAQAAFRLNDDGRSLTLRGVQDRVRRIFELTGLSRHSSIEIEPQVDAADA